MNQKRPTQEQIMKIYERLPDQVREAIMSMDISRQLVQIYKRNELHVDQMGVVSDEVGYVLAGVIKSTDLANNLRQRLNLPLEKINELMREINAEVFSKIQDHIRKAQEVSAEVLREEESLARNNAIITGAQPNPIATNKPNLFQQRLGVQNPTATNTTTQTSDTKTRLDPYREPVE